MKTRTVQLGDVCEFVRGVTFDKAAATTSPASSMVPILRAGNIGTELNSQDDLIWVPESFVADEQRLRQNDIVICMSSGSPEVVGKTARVPANLSASIGSFCGIIRPRQHEHAAFLSFFFRSTVFARLRDTIARGANIQNLRFAEFAEIEIELPSEQQRIAGVLEQADRLRRTRRYALELSDSFLPAAFRQLFGDPVRNSLGWPCVELEEVAEVDRGKFTPRPRNDPSYYGGTFPFIQTGDISNSGGHLNSWTQTLNEKGVRVSRSFPPGTVVIAIVGATIGMTSILEIEVYCPDSVVGIQVNRAKATVEYLEMLLRFWRPVFLAQAPETARANLNLDALRPLRIPLPPLALQQQFASLVSRHERLRAVQRESLRQAEHLFQSLLHRAFTTGL